MSSPPPYPPGQPGPPPWSPHGYGPAPWPYGAPPGPPVPPGGRRWNRTTIALVTGGVLLAVALLVVVVLAGLSVGRSQVRLPDVVAVPTTAPPSAPAGLGDDPGLDGYAQRCHDGLLSACDDLYQLSEPMSGYEQYGLTCGGRVKPLEVDACTDLAGD